MRQLKFFMWPVLMLTIASCKKDLTNNRQANGTITEIGTKLTRSGQPTVLGKKIPMYCETDKVKAALADFKKLKGISNSSGQLRTDTLYPVVQPNFKYVRFLPKDEDELLQLDEAGLDLTDEPMHFEIEIPGDYYQDPSIPDSSITWMYTVLPIDYQLPTTIQTEVISNVFLFNTEPEALEPDESEDGYDDDNGLPNCYNNNPYIDRGSIVPCIYSKRSKLMQAGYEWLTNQGVDADEFELYLMHQMGYHGDDYDSTVTNGRKRKYYPDGFIRVEDNDVRNLFPVKGIMVKSRNFLKIKRGYTDVNGHFHLDRGYRKKAQIILKWKNRGVATRGIDNWLKVWDLIFPIKHKLGWFYRTDLENVRHDYLYNANERTQDAERWSASHYLNSLWEVYEQSPALGTPRPPDKLRVYLVARWFNGSAFTPMFSQVYGRNFPIEEFNQLLQLKLGRAIRGALKKLLLKNAPDIFIPTFQTINGIRSTENASDLINTCYHETGHAIHFAGASVGADYWKNNTYPAYGYNLVAYGGDYGPKTGPFSPFVAVTEMWGFYYGNTMTVRKYQGIGGLNAAIIRQTNLDQLENNIPDDNINVQYFTDRSRSWIPLGMPHDMTDVGELVLTGVTDNANAYNMQRVFTGMAAGATDVCGYTSLTLAANNNLQATEVTQLLTDYRWNICCINCRPSNSKK